MLIRKITQDTSVVCDVSTNSGLYQARSRSGMLFKYLIHLLLHLVRTLRVLPAFANDHFAQLGCQFLQILLQNIQKNTLVHA